MFGGKVHSSISTLINWRTVKLSVTLQSPCRGTTYSFLKCLTIRFQHQLSQKMSRGNLYPSVTGHSPLGAANTHPPIWSHISLSSRGHSSTSKHGVVLLKPVSAIVWSQGREEMAIGCNRIWFWPLFFLLGLVKLCEVTRWRVLVLKGRVMVRHSKKPQAPMNNITVISLHVWQKLSPVTKHELQHVRSQKRLWLFIASHSQPSKSATCNSDDRSYTVQ